MSREAKKTGFMTSGSGWGRSSYRNCWRNWQWTETPRDATQGNGRQLLPSFNENSNEHEVNE